MAKTNSVKVGEYLARSAAPERYRHMRDMCDRCKVARECEEWDDCLECIADHLAAEYVPEDTWAEFTNDLTEELQNTAARAARTGEVASLDFYRDFAEIFASRAIKLKVVGK